MLLNMKISYCIHLEGYRFTESKTVPKYNCLQKNQTFLSGPFFPILLASNRVRIRHIWELC